jgi:hypothetical protein
MTTLEIKLDLPDRLAREALAAGLLTPQALREMLKEAMQRRAAQALLSGAAKATQAGSKPLPPPPSKPPAPATACSPPCRPRTCACSRSSS